MKGLLFSLLFFCSVLLSAQTLNPWYQSIVDSVQEDSVLSNLQTFESFGTKSLSSNALRNTATWLCNRFTALGYPGVVRDTFSYSGNTLYNIIATKTGSVYPNKYLILCGHYDTSNGPGTNDDGSGISIMMEVARLIQSIPTEYSIKFICFSAEEAGLIGSEHYVSHTVVPAGMDILLVLNIDEVGGVAGQINNTVTCEYDAGSPSSNNSASQNYTDTLAVLTGLYSSLQTSQASAYGSDYMSFEDNGNIITGYYEYNESSYVHTSSDNLAHLDTSYVTELARAALGSALYFARAYQVVVGRSEMADPGCRVFPNPASSGINVVAGEAEDYEFILYTVSGTCAAHSGFSGNQGYIDVSGLPPALYYYTLSGLQDGRQARGKVVILK